MIQIIKEKNIGIVERFGKYHRIMKPGINLYIPGIDFIVSILSTKINSINLEVETKTIDNATTKLVISVQYRIIEDKVYHAYYDFCDHVLSIKAYVYDIVRAIVPKLTIDELFYKKEELANDILNDIYKTMVNHGFEIIKTLVIDICPDSRVISAMNEFNIEQRKRAAAVEKGEGDKILKIKKAEADFEAAVLHGKGIAAQRKEIALGFRGILDSVHKDTHLTEKEIASMLLNIYYLDTMKEIGANSNSIYLNANLKENDNIFDNLESSFRSSLLSTDKIKKNK